jgi:predicted alpha/beta hydrolase
VIHCGASIAALRYRHFAAFLAQAGMPTFTYDYRGIGLSRPPGLRGFDAAVEDWAEYDCAAGVA